MKKEESPELQNKENTAPAADTGLEETKTGKLTEEELDNVTGGILAMFTKVFRKNCPYCNQVVITNSAEQLDAALEEHIRSAHPDKA